MPKAKITFAPDTAPLEIQARENARR